MKKSYLLRKREELVSHLAQLNAENVDASSYYISKIKYMTHQIRGNAINFGFDELAALADELDKHFSVEKSLSSLILFLNKMLSYVVEKITLLEEKQPGESSSLPQY